ncbi:hypothetical protein Golob_007968, partial [Gossypium lobatum]|nr:hypothetical protein [Gossypium lobatum]
TIRDSQFEFTLGVPTSKKYFLLNTDGFVSLQFGNAAAGGIVLDESGDWLEGSESHTRKLLQFYEFYIDQANTTHLGTRKSVEFALYS